MNTLARFKGSVTTFPHQDHLGSPIAETGLSGAVNWREAYSAFGEKRLDPVGNRDNEGFTGHIDDAASGLTYMQARYYDPVIGRFLSNDPVGFSVDMPQQFNRYSYTWNDPINKVDPDGELCVPCATGAIGGALGAISNTAAQYQRNGGSFENFSFGELGAATVTGIAFGATGGAAAAAGGVAGGAAATVIGYTGAVTVSAINDKELTLDTLKDTAVDEATGKGLGKAFKVLDDVPTDVTEAGLSVGDSVVTAATPADEPVEIEQPDREEQ